LNFTITGYFEDSIAMFAPTRLIKQANHCQDSKNQELVFKAASTKAEVKTLGVKICYSFFHPEDDVYTYISPHSIHGWGHNVLGMP